jgi:hypothetical protein
MSSHIFHFREKTALESCRRQFQKQLSGRESAPDAREKRSLPRATRVSRNGRFCLAIGGQGEGDAGQCKAQGRIRLSTKLGEP